MAHWRDHLNSTLLGAYSLYDDATDGFKEVDGFILRACHEKHVLGKSGNKDILVVYTSLSKTKLWKVNVKIADAISLSAGNRNPEKWINVPVTFYVDRNVDSKEGIVDALRCKANKASRAKLAEARGKSKLLLTSPNFEDIKKWLAEDGHKLSGVTNKFDVEESALVELRKIKTE